ncbi:MAG: D-tyrosyl-tRNA(Tyr) deacylase [Dehalococcoidia bacterium]|nr:D-tyrosyl-tRNA(Tyr) deacylase [Dehalococcoidia bacterium]
MKALLQRVAKASVSVNGDAVGNIGRGLVVFLGVAQGDGQEDADYLANKVVNQRVFADGTSHFALSALEVKADILVVSQFTLLADTRKGRRPSFTEAAPPELAQDLYGFFVERLRSTGLKVATGLFQEHMLVEIHNDGPVTILLESKTKPVTH